MRNMPLNLFPWHLYVVAISIVCIGCTPLSDQYAAYKYLNEIAQIKTYKKYPLNIAIITNTFHKFSFKPDVREGVYFESGGCQNNPNNPKHKNYSAFQFPIVGYSSYFFHNMFDKVDFVNANSNTQFKDKYDLVVRIILLHVFNHSKDSRKYAKLNLVVNIEFRTNDGKILFDKQISGYGESTSEEMCGTYLDRCLNVLNEREVDPASYNYRAAVQKSMLDVFIKLEEILDNHPNFIDKHF